MIKGKFDFKRKVISKIFVKYITFNINKKLIFIDRSNF